jgi:Flp pilus assembly protein TadB
MTLIDERSRKLNRPKRVTARFATNDVPPAIAIHVPGPIAARYCEICFPLRPLLRLGQAALRRLAREEREFDRAVRRKVRRLRGGRR